MQATRLGNGSRDWQLSALDQLLLRAKPELPDGRRRLYVCGGDCECSHIACFMESRESLIVWREFQYGSPSYSQAEVFRNGTWERVDFGSGPGPKGFDLPSRPLFFEEFAYRKVFELLYDKLVNDKGLRT